MKSWGKPGVDQSLKARHGVSRQGQLLSYNRAPASDLAPWIAGFYATAIEAPAEYRVDCGLLSDQGTIRIQLTGQWSAQTRDGELHEAESALFFGPQSRLMPISVIGSFISVGIALRPGTGHALFGFHGADYVDRFVTLDSLGLPGSKALGLFDLDAPAEAWIEVLEGLSRTIVERSGARRPDPVTARFEELALVDPAKPIAEFAHECGVDLRRLERISRRDFGLSPKQVLRRARALDMAAQLRGVGDEAEADELALRFYDQSHLIREFTSLFGMAPRAFVASAQPILTLSLESRQARRLEAIARIAPGERRPWEAPPPRAGRP